jgi:hypothetical protein
MFLKEGNVVRIDDCIYTKLTKVAEKTVPRGMYEFYDITTIREI